MLKQIKFAAQKGLSSKRDDSRSRAHSGHIDVMPRYPLPSAQNEGSQEREIPMVGTHVTIAATNSGKFDSYVASPVSERGTGVVIVSTISGVDSDMMHYADALAVE